MKFYAVKAGRKTGIFESWDECSKSVRGYSGAIYKSFKTYAEASAFLDSSKENSSTKVSGNSSNKAGLRKNSLPEDVVTGDESKMDGFSESGPIKDNLQENTSPEERMEEEEPSDDSPKEREDGEIHENGRKKSRFPQIRDHIETGRVDDYVLTASAKAYVDGSYLAGTGEFSYGCVVLFGDTEFRFYEKMTDTELSAMHNVAGEIKGAEAAMRFAIANGISDLTIYHDYEGIARWCTGEWTPKKSGTIAYCNFYQDLPKDLRVRFVKVQGHSGDTYNELADRLAKFALGIAE